MAIFNSYVKLPEGTSQGFLTHGMDQTATGMDQTNRGQARLDPAWDIHGCPTI